MTTERGGERHCRYNHSEKGRKRAREYWRRKAGWYEPGGMASDEEMANLRELGRKFRLI